MKRLITIMVTIMFLAATQSAMAATIIENGWMGDFTGDFSYNVINDQEANVNISITNMSDPAVGAYLTGFAFSLPFTGDDVAVNSVTFSSTNSDFSMVTGNGHHGKSGAFGSIGAVADTTNGHCPCSATTSAGIAPGETGDFVFTLMGTNLDAWTVDDFFSEMPTDPHHYRLTSRFAVSFNMPENSGCPTVPGQPVPVPGTLLLLYSGFICLMGFRKRLS